MHNVRFIAQRVPGKGWTVAKVTGSKRTGRTIERAPGFETLDTYYLDQAQAAADAAQRDYNRGAD